jgi:serine/threonine protein kinase
MTGKTAASATNIMNEVRLLRRIDHPCIIRLEDVVDTEDELFKEEFHIFQLCPAPTCKQYSKTKARHTSMNSSCRRTTPPLCR